MTKKRKSSFRGKVNKDSKRQTSGYGYLNLPKGISVFNPEPKSMVKLDFMPYKVTSKRHPDRNVEDEIAVPGSLWYKLPFKIHRNVGVDNDRVVCLTSIGKPCPICEKRSEMIRQEADKEDSDALKQSLRNLYVVIPLDSKKHDADPHILDMSQYLCQEEINNTLEEDEEFEIFPDLEEGWTMKCRFDASTMGTSKPFAELGKVTPIERKEQYTEDILDDIPNLDEVLNILSYKELEAKFLELDEEEDPDEKEQEEEQLTTRRRKTKEPEETPDEEKPTRTRKHKGEEPEEEVEEVEEAKPKRTRRKPAEEKKETLDDKCPHGHTFGEDCDEYPKDCNDCDEWDACGEEQDKKIEYVYSKSK